MEENSINKSQAWNPILIGVLSFFFTFLPGGIFYSINYARMGYPEKKNPTLITVILGFIIFSAAVYLIPEDIPTIQISTLINASVAGYFIYSQKKLYEQHLKKGGEKAPFILPVVLSMLWFIIITLLILVMLNRDPYETEYIKEDQLVYAAESANIDKVKRLLNEGVDVNTSIPYRGTALIAAAFEGDSGIVKLLLENGADVQVRNNAGDTPLIAAAVWRESPKHAEVNEIIKMLIAKGADINARNRENRTVLLGLVQEQNLEGVKFLIENGADVNAINDYGKSVLIAANETGNSELISLLEEAGAK